MAYDDGFRPYVSVAERKREAQRYVEKLRKQGRELSPVLIEGRAIASTFWGKAWCQNLERYSDYENRLPRGRTYARNGSIIDLQIEPGRIAALVSGTEIYEVTLGVAKLPPKTWKAIRKDCSGAIDSLVELLQGRLSKGVMERICRQQDGLFPSPRELKLDCSCPDYADMCKHVAAVLYGVGARLDEKPELLFNLRDVDHGELVAAAASSAPFQSAATPPANVLVDSDLSALFGIELGSIEDVEVVEDEPIGSKRAAASKKSSGKASKGSKAKPVRKTQLAAHRNDRSRQKGR